MKWQPVSEYKPEMGCVLVWLQWSSYGLSAGDWFLAYQIIITDAAPVWVTAHDSIPIETTSRRVTHFHRKVAP